MGIRPPVWESGDILRAVPSPSRSRQRHTPGSEPRPSSRRLTRRRRPAPAPPEEAAELPTLRGATKLDELDGRGRKLLNQNLRRNLADVFGNTSRIFHIFRAACHRNSWWHILEDEVVFACFPQKLRMSSEITFKETKKPAIAIVLDMETDSENNEVEMESKQLNRHGSWCKNRARDKGTRKTHQTTSEN